MTNTIKQTVSLNELAKRFEITPKELFWWMGEEGLLVLVGDDLTVNKVFIGMVETCFDAYISSLK